MRRLRAIVVALFGVTAVVALDPGATATVAFATSDFYASPATGPMRAQVADLDADGYPDFVVGATSGTTVGIMNNDGDGTFTGSSETACSLPQYIAVGSLDSANNTAPDILAQCSGAPPVTLIGDGMGGFNDPIASGITYYIRGYTELGHYDAPAGTLDVAFQGFGTLGQPQPFGALLGDGDGTFDHPGTALDVGGEIETLDLDDAGLFGDAAIAVSYARDKINFFYYDQTMVGSDFYLGQDRPTGGQEAAAIETGDIDGDSDTDIVVFNHSDAAGAANPNLALLIKTAGRYPESAPPTIPTIRPVDGALGDFDGDGDLDIAVLGPSNSPGWPNPARATVAIHTNDGTGTFAAPQLFPAGAHEYPMSLAAADVDVDGTTDLIVSIRGDNNLIEVIKSIPDATAPTTTITSTPKLTVRTSKPKVKVTFGFIANEAATFECTMDGTVFANCVSPAEFKVGRGQHTFTVAATDHAGNADLTPASYDFKVKRR